MEQADRSDLYQRAEENARQTVQRWIGHPAVKETVESVAPTWFQVVSGLRRQIVAADQIGGSTFLLGLFDGVFARLDPKPATYLDPFDVCPPSRRERARRDRAATLLRVLAGDLVAKGVAIDPKATCDLVVLGQLCWGSPPCPSEYAIDWSMTPSEMVRTLDVPSLSGVGDSGYRAVSVRRGQSRPHRNVDDRIRSDWQDRLAEGQDLRDRGGRPTGSAVDDAVAEMLSKYPDATASRMLKDWQRNVRGSAGVRLRELLGRPIDQPPSRSSLDKALNKARKNLA